MASKRRKRQKGCKGKVRHNTKDEALDAMRKIKNVVCPLNVYKCDNCGAWHVGRKFKNLMETGNRKKAHIDRSRT